MIRTTIAKFFFLSQALFLITDINGFIINDHNLREKRDVLSLLSGTDSLVSASDVNPLEVIPIPLKMEMHPENSEQESYEQEEEEEENNYHEEEDNYHEENQNLVGILEKFKTPESDINSENFDQKLNDLKLMYETAISNLRTETVGAQTYIQKKTSLAEKHLENIFKSVELMVNNRVDLSFHSIETKMNEAQKVLNTLNSLILRNLETKLKSIESDLLAQVKEEKAELENKMNLFSEKVEVLSQKLSELVTQRVNQNLNRSEDQINSTNSTAEPETIVSNGNNYFLNDIAELENVSEKDLDEQTQEVDDFESTTDNTEYDESDQEFENTEDNQIDTTDTFEYEESEEELDENPIDSEILLRAMGQSANEYDYEEDEEDEEDSELPIDQYDLDFYEPRSNSAFDYYYDNHPRQFERQVVYSYY